MISFVESVAAQVEVARCGAYACCSNEKQDWIRDVGLAAGAAYFDDMIGRVRMDEKNEGLDLNHDGIVTKQEATEAVIDRRRRYE